VRLNRLLNLILETAVDALGFSATTVTTRHDGDLVEWNASTNCGRSHTPATGAHGRRTVWRTGCMTLSATGGSG
jgi:hypothetical protein